MPMPPVYSSIALIIDLFAVAVGIISAVMIFSQGQRLGGRVGTAVNLFVWGALFQAFAFIYSIVSAKSILPDAFNNLPFDPHHLLMAIGMVFFLFSTKKFVGVGIK